MLHDETRYKRLEIAPTEVLAGGEGSLAPGGGLTVAESSLMIDAGNFPWEQADRNTPPECCEIEDEETLSAGKSACRPLNFPGVRDTASLSDGLLSDGLASDALVGDDEPVPVERLQDELISDEPVPVERLQDELISDEPVPVERLQDELISDEPVPVKMVRDELISDEPTRLSIGTVEQVIKTVDEMQIDSFNDTIEQRPSEQLLSERPLKSGFDAQVLKPQTGTILEGRYRLLRKLGSGGTADVYQAIHVSLGNTWAIKVLPHADNTLQDHLKEADILKRLNHPMLPRIADIIRTNTHTCIVMDYLSGVNLLERIEAEGRIRESEVHAWMLQICDVLAYLHSQQPAAIIYRDLKPSNLIADDYGHLKLVDFGTARTYQTGNDGDTAYIGTQGYAAPEQYGVNQSDGRTDLYNLGMTVIHLLTGIHPVTIPHGGLEEKLLEAGIAPGFIAVILGCVHISPGQRFQDAVSCRTALLESMEQSQGAHGNRGIRDGSDSDAVKRDESHSAAWNLKQASTVAGQYGRKTTGEKTPAGRSGVEGNVKPVDSGPSFGFSSVLKRSRRNAPILSGQTRIAIMGVCPGAGATFACIALSSLFAMRRFDTACFELNPSGDLSRLRDTLIHAGHLPEMDPASQHDSFRFGSVDFHFGCRKISDLQTRRYEVTLADMGARCGGNALDEFHRADWQFIYCPQADWKLGRIGDFFESYDPCGRETRFHYLFPMEGEGDARILRAIFGKRNAHAFPQIRNPFEPGKQEIRQLERVLGCAGLSG